LIRLPYLNIIQSEAEILWLVEDAVVHRWRFPVDQVRHRTGTRTHRAIDAVHGFKINLPHSVVEQDRVVDNKFFRTEDSVRVEVDILERLISDHLNCSDVNGTIFIDDLWSHRGLCCSDLST